MINPILIPREDLERICAKSRRVTGSKWKWRKIAEKHVLTWQEMEAELDIKIDRDNKLISRLKEQYGRRSTNKQLGNDDGGNTTDGAGKEDVSASQAGDSSSGDADTVDGDLGSEVRSGQTKNGTTPVEGSE